MPSPSSPISNFRVADASLRIDKFLWHARLARTRSLAKAMAESGHIRCEGRRIERAHAVVRIGDVLSVPLPSGVRLESLAEAGHAPGQPRYDVALLFVDELGALVAEFEALSERIEVDGGVWVCWPKMKSPLFKALREGDVRAHGLEVGLVDNKICAVDEDWSGLRFVYRREDRPALRASRGGEA